MTSTNEPSNDDERPSFGLPGRFTDPSSRLASEESSEEGEVEASEPTDVDGPDHNAAAPDVAVSGGSTSRLFGPTDTAPGRAATPSSESGGGVWRTRVSPAAPTPTAAEQTPTTTPLPAPTPAADVAKASAQPTGSPPAAAAHESSNLSGIRDQDFGRSGPGVARVEPPSRSEPYSAGSGAGESLHSTPPQSTPPPAAASAVVEGSEPAPTAAERPRRGPDGGPRIIAIANQKGGVGKTTTTVNLGAAAAELGHRVLIVDLDPQGNASTGLGINPRSLEASMYDVLLHDVPIDEAIEAAEVRNLFVAPANLDLAGAEIELVPAFSRELRLKNAIADVADDFDMVLIDCPPSLGLLTVNAFAAASEVLVPVQCEYYALEGLGQLLRNVDLVKRNLNGTLELSAIVLVMFDARTNLASQVADEVREHFGSKVCRAVIPRNIRLSEAPSFGQPITVFDPSSRGAIAYRDLAKEVAGEPT